MQYSRSVFNAFTPCAQVPMLELSKAVQRVAAVERKAAQEAVAAAEVVKEQRIKAEKDLAVKEQEVLQLMAALKVCASKICIRLCR